MSSINGPERKKHNPKKVVRELKLEPGRAKTVGLGTYKDSDPVPDFYLEFKPYIEDAIGASLDRLEIHGSAKYMLFYQFHNFGTEVCHITVLQDT